MNDIFRNIDITTKALNASWKRNEIIANNIANANTPNFKRSDVVFNEILKDYLKKDNIKLKTTHEKHIQPGIDKIEDLNYRIVNSGNYQTRRDGNNVDIDVEMAELAKNHIVYNTLANQVNNNIQKIKMVLREGGR